VHRSRESGRATSDGEALFDANGSETPYPRHKLALLAELIDGEQKSRMFADRLVALDLLQGIELELKAPGQPTRKISGFFSACCPLSDTCRSSRAAVFLRRRSPAAEEAPRKEKAPATFVTGASLLGPWQ